MDLVPCESSQRTQRLQADTFSDIYHEVQARDGSMLCKPVVPLLKAFTDVVDLDRRTTLLVRTASKQR